MISYTQQVQGQFWTLSQKQNYGCCVINKIIFKTDVCIKLTKNKNKLKIKIAFKKTIEKKSLTHRLAKFYLKSE